MKYYVVWRGRKPGVYETWNECKEQIDNFTGATYKAFPSMEDAMGAFRSEPSLYLNRKAGVKPGAKAGPRTDIPSISVDAACSGNPGIMEYQGVDTQTKRLLFHQGPYPDASNNVGEFLALVHGLAYLDKHAYFDTPIYSDSVTAMAWVRAQQCKTKIERTTRNAELFELVLRAEVWLKKHRYRNPIIKWETELWGEIPADFGRK